MGTSLDVDDAFMKGFEVSAKATGVAVVVVVVVEKEGDSKAEFS
jgi:hypothetical protein